MKIVTGNIHAGADVEAALAAEPIRLVEFTRAFYLGGTEMQLVELLRGLRPRYHLRVGALGAQGPLVEQVRQLGLEPELFPLGQAFLRPETAWQVGRLARWLRRERVELVHVHDFAATLVVVPAARLAGCKLIVGRLDLAHWQGPAQRAALVGLTRLADHVIANAEAIRELLVEEEGLPAGRITVVRNGLDLPRFDARRREGLRAPLPETGGAPVVIHVANMNHPVKRQEDLLAAQALLKRQGVRLHTFLVGDGPRRPELQRLAGELDVADVVHFLGHRTDVPALYGVGTMGVLCSSAEGLSNALMEGMAAGLPMVVTRAGGNPELVADGERGWVVEPFAPEQLADGMRQLLSAPERARQMGERGRAFIARELTLERMVAGHDAVYRAVARKLSLIPARRAPSRQGRGG